MQQRHVVRARDLASFREALVELALTGAPLEARRRAVIVPTRASAELLRQTIESRLARARPAAAVLPDILTRAEWLEQLLGALEGSPRLLGRAEREVLLARAARATARRARLGGAPFPLRPGLVAAMLEFYDELRRRQRSVRRMTGSLFEQLKAERGTDRGSESLLHQTCFLAFSFLAYERAARASGGLDEHALRRELLEAQPPLAHSHVVIAVADQPSDPRGLWPADFDLVGRLRHLTRLDIVVTDGAHDAGFRERLEQELPGVEEDRRTADFPKPLLLRPPDAGAAADTWCAVSHDREEELRDVARAIRARAAGAGGALHDRTAIVFHRPLPYLYLSQNVLTEARVPYQAFDALPLAAEPYAALLDMVMAVARTGGTRDSMVALLRSRVLQIDVDGAPVLPGEVSALDQVLAERRASGDAESFASEVARHLRASDARRSATRQGALRAARAAAFVAAALRAFREAGTASAQVRAVVAFLRAHERLPAETDPWRERHMRARAAVLGALEALADAFERHDDESRPHEELTSAIAHAIEAQTFTPRRGVAGVHLVDAVAARFGEFDHAHLVGLVETDWPERSRRNIFYTTGLLRALGWPQEVDQARVERASFADLLGLAARTVRLSAFRIEGDMIVALSPMVELARGVSAAVAPPPAHRRVFDDEVLTHTSSIALAIDPGIARWLDTRLARADLKDPRFGGSVGPQAPQRYRVSRVDRYGDCPFKYFAENVLGLPEEREDNAGLSPLERGVLVHRLFEQFYREWDRDPGGTITAATLPEAVERFTTMTEAELARLPEADRVLERARLLGSLVAPGIAEQVFELEVDAGQPVARRLVEIDLRGPFGFPQLGGLKTRTIDIHGKADRIDVLENGALRVVDYKLSRLPDKHTSIQIAVYAHVARLQLEQADGRPHPIAAAMYLAFGDEDEFKGALGGRDRPVEGAVLSRVEQFAAMVDHIESGAFPPKPRRLEMCGWCRYAGVCRKEYRAEDDGAAESV